MNQNNNSPLVSIGIPAFNRPDGLQRILTCSTEQSYKNIEIIVSDNYSPNEGVEIITKEYMKKDPRIRFFRQTENRGGIFNFEFVLKESKGDYFLWAADDDLCDKDYISKLLSCFTEYPDIVLCGSDTKIVDENDNVIRIEKLDTIYLNNKWKKTRKHFFSYPISNISFAIYGLYKTAILKNHGIEIMGGWRGFIAGNEVPFLAQIATHGRIAAIPYPLKTYRTHPESAYVKEANNTSNLEAYILGMHIRKKLLWIIYNAPLSLSEKTPLLANVIKSFLFNLFPRQIIKKCIAIFSKYSTSF